MLISPAATVNVVTEELNFGERTRKLSLLKDLHKWSVEEFDKYRFRARKGKKNLDYFPPVM